MVSHRPLSLLAGIIMLFQSPGAWGGLAYKSMRSTTRRQKLGTLDSVSGLIFRKVPQSHQKIGPRTFWDASPITCEVRFCWRQAMKLLNSLLGTASRSLKNLDSTCQIR